MALAQQAGCAFRKQIDANAIPDELLDLVPLSFARSRQVLPLELTEDGVVIVALADPYDLSVVSDLQLMMQRPLVTEVATPTLITASTNSAYDRATRLAEDAAEGLEESHAEEEEEFAIQDILDAEDEARRSFGSCTRFYPRRSRSAPRIFTSSPLSARSPCVPRGRRAA